MPSFSDQLNPDIIKPLPTQAGEFKPEDLSDAEEKEYLSSIKKRNKYYLIQGLSDEEKQRIANKIIQDYDDAKHQHDELCEKIREWDEVSRLLRKEVIGSSGELPNYRTPLSLVTQETIHANILNVFFSPQDIMRVIPTANEDVPKVNNVTVFGNWSLKNELNIFDNIDTPCIHVWLKVFITQ